MEPQRLYWVKLKLSLLGLEELLLEEFPEHFYFRFLAIKSSPN